MRQPENSCFEAVYVIVTTLNTIPVLPVVAVVLKLIVASSPGCDEVVPDFQVQYVELVMPEEGLGRYCTRKRQRDHHHCRQRPCHIYQSRENTVTDSEAPFVIQQDELGRAAGILVLSRNL